MAQSLRASLTPLPRARWVAVAVAATLLLVAGAVWVHSYEATRVRESLREGLAVVGELKTSQIQRWRLEREGDASVIVQNPLVVAASEALLRGAPLGAAEPKLRALFDATESAYGYSNILMVAVDGRLLFVHHAPAGRIGPTTLATVDSAAKSAATVLSNFYRGVDTLVHVDVAHSVRNESGRVLAVVVLRTSAETYLYALLQNWPTRSQTSTSTIQRRDGENVVVLRNMRRTGDGASPGEAVATLVPLTRTDVAPVRAALGDRGSFEGLDERGVRVLAYLTAVPGTAWNVITRMDETEVDGIVGNRTKSVAVIWALFILLVNAMIAYAYHRQKARLLEESYAAERKEREHQARLVHAERLASMGQMAGGIAHDFNNVLSVIVGAVSLARASESRPVIDENLDMANSAAARAADLTGQLLAFARQQPSKTARFKARERVDALRGMLRRLAGPSVSLSIDPGPDSAELIELDPSQFDQVVLNLVVNARDAMPEGGKLSIVCDVANFDERPATVGGTVPAGRYARVCVADTGVGMSTETLDKVFEPFYTTKGDRGTGLGLATTSAIVRGAGGYVIVTSVVAQGTRFEVLLPVVT